MFNDLVQQFVNLGKYFITALVPPKSTLFLAINKNALVTTTQGWESLEA